MKPTRSTIDQSGQGPNSADTAEIEVWNLQRTYRVGTTEVQALRGVDLRVEPGEFVGVGGVKLDPTSVT